jgi:hypothetical protein
MTANANIEVDELVESVRSMRLGEKESLHRLEASLNRLDIARLTNLVNEGCHDEIITFIVRQRLETEKERRDKEKERREKEEERRENEEERRDKEKGRREKEEERRDKEKGRREKEDPRAVLDDMSLLLKGFPLLGTRQLIASSDASIGGTVKGCNYIPACIIERTFGLSDFNDVLLKSKSTRLRQLRSQMYYTNELSISRFVSLALDDIIATLPVDSEVCWLDGCNLGVLMGELDNRADTVPNIFVVRDEAGRRLGLVEMKIPDPERPDDAKKNVSTVMASVSEFVGQIYDYLVLAQEHFGQRFVFFILTTYAGWRVYWLPTADEMARHPVTLEEVRSGIKSNISDFDISKHPEIEKEAVKLFANAGLTDEVRNRANKRILFATKVFTVEQDGQGEMCELVRVLMSAIVKMICSLKLPSWWEGRNFTLNAGDACISATVNQFAWSILGPKMWERNKYRLEFVNPRTHFAKGMRQPIYFLRHLGCGLHGSAWLAGVLAEKTEEIEGKSENVEVTMHLFVVKRTTSANAELNIWNLAYDDKPDICPIVKKLGGMDALLMPFFDPVTEAEQGSKNIWDMVRGVVQTQFWNKRISHGDVRWANIGWRQGDSGDRDIVLFDFGMSHECESVEAAMARDRESQNSHEELLP